MEQFPFSVNIALKLINECIGSDGSDQDRRSGEDLVFIDRRFVGNTPGGSFDCLMSDVAFFDDFADI